ncbi:protein SHORT HYPOCOTYL IN WHITE LIGHT 1-like [Macadamia integrifolia]|uniref:protein SHORT HYPOCOTYL IN WHITE LIGHT 1-like n=1 Tax=Macadamia integrifolia TaxID=60698 RepID=UPI001C4EF760|nr:protein SHORT HYPOCOTYL IN WHITE LIGHT 1-like [Macadamia integrifolia]
MAVAAVSSPVANPLLPSTSLCCSRLSSTNLTLSHLAFRPSLLHLRYNRCPGSSICNGKPNASLGRETEDIGEVFFGGDDEMEDESEEEDSDSSVDLLFRFTHSIFRKVSKRAKKATRSILPHAISPQLVSFAVDGVLLLTSLSIVKALLEVICNLGGAVFFVILLLRVIWMAVSHFQSSGSNLNQGGSSYGTMQPSS